MNMKYFKKFCIYFIAIFTIAMVCGFTGLVIKEVDNGTFYDLDTIEALGYDGGESCRNTSIELFRPQR